MRCGCGNCGHVSVSGAAVAAGAGIRFRPPGRQPRNAIARLVYTLQCEDAWRAHAVTLNRLPGSALEPVSIARRTRRLRAGESTPPFISPRCPGLGPFPGWGVSLLVRCHVEDCPNSTTRSSNSPSTRANASRPPAGACRSQARAQARHVKGLRPPLRVLRRLPPFRDSDTGPRLSNRERRYAHARERGCRVWSM